MNFYGVFSEEHPLQPHRQPGFFDDFNAIFLPIFKRSKLAILKRKNPAPDNKPKIKTVVY